MRTLATIAERFQPGEVYEIGGDAHHTIEELSDLILRVTGADPGLVEYRDAEVLTTRVKRVDISKAIRDLEHKTTVSLEEGVRRTGEWLRDAYRL